MNSASSFLLASRACEIAELEQLARSCELVGVLGALIHALQRERGLSNLYLSSRGQRFAEERLAQVLACEAAEAQVRQHLAGMEQMPPQRLRHGSRLFSQVALALHAIDTLPALRARIAHQAIAAPEASAGLGKRIAALLAVVFEAADSATDPQVSRALVALFHCMQGKELAGQERALGARVFAAGCIDDAGRQQWRHLVDSQSACLQVCADFSGVAGVPAEDSAVMADIARLRHIGRGAASQDLDSHLSQAWYQVCTRRIDAMRLQEEQLARHLRGLCERRIALARSELRDQQATLDRLLGAAQPLTPEQPVPIGPRLERAVLAMVQQQAQRLQAMGDELEAVRASLQERKVVEKAKGLLMAQRHLSEDDAYKALRQLAMNQNRRIADVAATVLAVAAVLPDGAS